MLNDPNVKFTSRCVVACGAGAIGYSVYQRDILQILTGIILLECGICWVVELNIVFARPMGGAADE